MNFGISDSNGGGTNILISIKFITTDGHANAIDLCFVWSYGAEKICIGNLATGWDLMWLDEENRLGSGDCGIRQALRSGTNTTSVYVPLVQSLYRCCGCVVQCWVIYLDQ